MGNFHRLIYSLSIAFFKLQKDECAEQAHCGDISKVETITAGPYVLPKHLRFSLIDRDFTAFIFIFTRSWFFLK